MIRIYLNCVDWNTTTKEDVLNAPRDDFIAYTTSKVLAERALWKFAETHPEIDDVFLLLDNDPRLWVEV